jgi:hypothetical protein
VDETNSSGAFAGRDKRVNVVRVKLFIPFVLSTPTDPANILVATLSSHSVIVTLYAVKTFFVIFELVMS